MVDYSILNSEQAEAVTTIDDYVLIIAGAGTGKTTTLVYRIAYMIGSGIDPENILLLTFTNKAAEEMKNRVIKDIGPEAEKVTACTFHSFCANFLRKYSSNIGISNDFTVIDSPDSVDAISMCESQYLFDNKLKKFPDDFPTRKQIIAVLSYSVNSCKDLRNCILEKFEAKYLYEIMDIIERYQKYKKSHNMMDYDDLLKYTSQILYDFEDIRAKIDRQYKYISCDEYQDTNILQDRILTKISRDYPNLAVVGDDNQSIYKFRCAEIDNILNFKHTHPSCKVIVLNENYRSSQEILDFSNAIMSFAEEGIPKVLKGQFHGERPVLLNSNDEKQECKDIVNRIKKLHFDGIPYKEMAVIIRSSSHSFSLESLFNRSGIPYKKFGGVRFLEKEVVKDILCFLRLMVNEKDEIALYRILKKYPGIGRVYAKRISDIIGIKDISAIKTVYRTSKFAKYLDEFADEIEKLKTMTLQEQLNEIIDNYYSLISHRIIDLSEISNKNEEYKKLKEGLSEAITLKDMAKGYKSIKKFLEDLVLDAAVPSDNGDFVNITTIHSAKGLEYDVVFIMNNIDGVFPRSKIGSDEDPEELRCLYVAVTRARKYLYLLAPEEYYTGRYSHAGLTPLSHFMCYDEVIDTLNISYISTINRMRKVSDIYNKTFL